MTFEAMKYEYSDKNFFIDKKFLIGIIRYNNVPNGTIIKWIICLLENAARIVKVAKVIDISR